MCSIRFAHMRARTDAENLNSRRRSRFARDRFESESSCRKAAAPTACAMRSYLSILAPRNSRAGILIIKRILARPLAREPESQKARMRQLWPSGWHKIALFVFKTQIIYLSRRSRAGSLSSKRVCLSISISDLCVLSNSKMSGCALAGYLVFASS